MLGQVTTVTDPNNATTSYSYDQWGRPLQVMRPGDDPTNPTVRYTYTNYGGASAPYWVKQEQKESGTSYLESRTFYDGLGRTVQTQAEAVSSSQSIVASTQYNPLGVFQATAPYTHTAGLGVNGNYRTPQWSQPSTYTTYDALGRVIRITQPDNSQVNTSYQDRTTTVLDPLNHKTVRITDAFGRLVTVQQYLGNGTPGDQYVLHGTTTYAYNVRDQLTGVTGPDGAVTTLTYDLAGRKTQMVDPDMGTWSYAYDAAGNLIRQTDAKNQRICFYYDGHNRLKGRPTRPAAPRARPIRATVATA